MQLLTHLLPRPLASQLVLGWRTVQGDYSKDILSAAERTEWDQISSSGRRREYLAARWLVRRLASELNINPDEFCLNKDELGKPYGRYKNQNYHVSIAHTEERVLCALSAVHKIGIDLEPANRSVPDRLRNRITNEREEALLAEEDTLRIWTIKEAMVKLQGQGMRTNLRECTVKTINDALVEATLNNEDRAKICSFIQQQHWLAIAWNL